MIVGLVIVNVFGASLVLRSENIFNALLAVRDCWRVDIMNRSPGLLSYPCSMFRAVLAGYEWNASLIGLYRPCSDHSSTEIRAERIELVVRERVMGKSFNQVYGRTALALFALFLLLPGFTAAADRILKIDPRHVEGMQNMPAEITSMLKELGYERLPLRDPVTGQPVQIVQELGQYRMLFRAKANTAVQIKVHIRIGDNVTGLYFSAVGSDQPGDAVQGYYQKLSERAALEFGEDSVSEGSVLFTP